MKAYISDGHYIVMVDREKEIPMIPGKTLSTKLQAFGGAEDLGKVIELALENAFSVTYTPSDASWDDLKKIRFEISREIHEKVHAGESSTQRFGAGESLDLNAEYDLDNMI
ncbi:MAG: hypothetical protein ABIA93_03280 [Candidatus Woesearchaeota archaeon]